MNNIVIILVLLAGLLGGYFIGDYRGANARRALAIAEETGNELKMLQEKYDTQLSAELDTVKQDYQKKIDDLNQKQASDSSEWARIKASLDDTIRQQQSKLQLLNTNLSQLQGKLNGATGAERQRLEQEIAHLRAQIGSVEREGEGTKCLAQQVPQSVIELLNRAKVAGGAQ